MYSNSGKRCLFCGGGKILEDSNLIPVCPGCYGNLLKKEKEHEERHKDDNKH